MTGAFYTLHVLRTVVLVEAAGAVEQLLFGGAAHALTGRAHVGTASQSGELAVIAQSPTQLTSIAYRL